MKSSRTAAASAIADVLGKGITLDQALERNLGRLAGRDRALAREIAYGVCRRYFELDGVLQGLLKKPLKDRDCDIHALALAGMYQLRYLRVPDHAAVGETVAATRELGKSWASGLVNAVLRAFLARGTALSAALSPAQQCSHPQWLFEHLQRAWPQQLEQIITANNEPAEMTLRINSARISRDEWLAQAHQQGIEAFPGTLAADAVLLQHPIDVEQLPGFAQGQLSVQDQAAQLAAPLLNCASGQRVLDACAAPGGKSCHLLERHPDIELQALDSQERRQQRVRDNLQRLGLQAKVLTGDAADPAGWWDGLAFDRILVDAPCSGSGVIRRHPDIKVLRTPAQIVQACQLQAAILGGIWPCLKPGGLLLYATCSVLAEENEDQIAGFLAATADASDVSLDVPWGLARKHGRQLLPQNGAHDGFYYALLRKA